MGLPGWRLTDGTGTTERVGDGIVHLIFTKSSIYTPSAQWPRRISLLLLLKLILSLLLFIACVIVIVSVIAITIVIESLPRIPPGQVVGYGLYVTCHSMFITCSLKTSWSLGVPSWASLGPSWGCLGRTWRLLGFTLGLSWAMLGPSRGYLGRTWGLLGTLGLEYRTWKTHTFLKVLLEHRPPVFVYKAMYFWIAAGRPCSSNIENAYCIVQRKLSPETQKCKTRHSVSSRNAYTSNVKP